MADISIIASAPGTLITQRPLDEVERRLSTALSNNERRRSSTASAGGRRQSLVAETLDKIDPEKRFGRRESLVTPHDLEVIREAKQVGGEAFATGGQTRYYEPIDSYEGKHRWDPKAEWTEQEEKKVIRKLDYKICAWVCFMFFALQLDRGNIGQALTDNMLREYHQGSRLQVAVAHAPPSSRSWTYH